MNKLFKDAYERLQVTTGHVMVEYGIVLVAIAILCILAVETIGISTGIKFAHARNQMP